MFQLRGRDYDLLVLVLGEVDQVEQCPHPLVGSDQDTAVPGDDQGDCDAQDDRDNHHAESPDRPVGEAPRSGHEAPLPLYVLLLQGVGEGLEPGQKAPGLVRV